MNYKAIDLFAGVGGLSLGFEKAGIDVVMANEYDKSIAESYIKNHPETNMIIGDIKTLPIQDTFKKFVGKIDVVIGGPPCQGFSQKGQRKSINDERNYLFKYFINVVSFVKPKFFLMENVPNLLTTEKGFFKKEIIELFEGLGYSVIAETMNAADFGVPQNRNRAFILGRLGRIAPSLPSPSFKLVTVWDAISDLSYLNSGEGENISEYRMETQTDYQKDLRKGSSSLYNHIATNHSKLAIERMSLIPPEQGREHLPKEHRTKSIYSGTWGRMVKDEVSVTITTRFDTPSSGRFTHPYLNRAITVREAARLQSFPDTFHFYGTKSSQMKQVGNAVPPLLAYSIAIALKNQLKGD
jgi:DNA-cytosine methyltransferase